MINAERLRAFYLLIVIAVCCSFIIGCSKPSDVVCTDLSELIETDLIICTDGKEPQLCMSQDTDNCGYYVNSIYIPCISCYDCDIASTVAVALCSAVSPSVNSSYINQVVDDPVAGKNEALLNAMEYLKESY